jgi:hypothetical protein
MLVGHYGVALLVKRVEPGLNLGLLFGAAMLQDLVLWGLVLYGVETVHSPADYSHGRFLTFDFPYSHGLLASLLWAIVAGLGGAWFAGDNLKARTFLLIGGVVFSHFLLDVLVHVPELPLVGQQSRKLGLGLWKQLPLAISLELLFATVASITYLRSPEPKAKRVVVGMLMTLMAVLTASQLWASQPPSSSQVAVSSLFLIVITCGIGAWIDRTGNGEKT